MSQPDCSRAELPHVSAGGRTLSDVRIDAPHAFPTLGGDRPLPPSGGHALGADAPIAPNPIQVDDGPTAVQQLRTQTIQLADHLVARQKELDRREAEINARAAELESGLRAARLWFMEREAELEQRRERWLQERRNAHQELEAARQQLDRQRRHDWADLQQKRRAIQRRAEEVDRAWVVLRQLHEEVARMHRETLELRLANEQLRAELAPCAPADVQQRALKDIRLKLSEEYRRAGEALARQKEELLAIQRGLAEQHRLLVSLREKLRDGAQRGS